MIKRLKKHISTYEDRAVVITAFSAVVNTVTAAGKLALGVSVLSFWYIVNAVYCFVLITARVIALYNYRRAVKAENPTVRCAIESDFHKRGGEFIFLIAFVYFLVCAYMALRNYAVVATGKGVYTVVFITIYKLVFSVYGLIITKKKNSLILRTLKAFSLADASLSVVITLCTVMHALGSGVSVISSAALGMVISSALMITGAIMVSKHRRNNKNA